MNTLQRNAARSLVGLACAVLPAAAALAAVAAPGAGSQGQVAPGLASAASPAAPTLPKLSAEQIVERNVAARGGLKAWHAVQSISYSGSLDAGRVRPDNGLNPSARDSVVSKPGKSTRIAQAPEQVASQVDAGTAVSLPYTLYMQRPNKQRVEVKFNEELLVQVYVGSHGWKLQPYLQRGGALPFTSEEMAKAKQFQEIDGPLIDYKAKGSTVVFDGTELVDARPAYRLKLTLKSGDVRRIWIDAETFLDVQIDGSRRFNGHQVPIFTAQRDFRQVEGVKVPYLLETRTAGVVGREKIVVDKVALNPALDGALFGKPN